MSAGAGPRRPPAPPSLWRDRAFLCLWTGQTVSSLGDEVSFIAVPFVAVVVLHVSAFGAGLLGFFQFLPFLVVGLPAGAIVDRLPRRAVMIAADAGRLLLMGSIPAADALGHLTLAQLYAVGLLVGGLTVFFDVAYQAYLPELVAGERLVDGNAKLEVSRSTAALAGPSLGGVLVAALGAPLAVAADAASFGWSAGLLAAIRGRGGAPEPHHGPRPSLRSDIAEGLGYVLRHRLIRMVAGCTATWNFFGHMGTALLVLFAVRDLDMGPRTVGLALSLGGLGTLAGALLCSRVSARVGVGRAVLLGALASPSLFLLPLATPRTAILMLALSGAIGGAGGVLYNVNQVSLRQAITPRRLQGRLNATMRFIVWGTIPLGALSGGLLGSLIGLRPTLVVSAAGCTLAVLWIVVSEVPGVARLEDLIPAELRAPAAAAEAP